MLFNRHYANRGFVNRNTHYLPPTSVIPTNQHQWNQQGTTTVYPHHPYPNQGYPSATGWNQHQNINNPPYYNEQQMGHNINVSQQPTAPYGEHLSQTHYGKH